jgi:hypothetical protein
MRTIKITITNQDGVILDDTQMEIKPNIKRIAVRPLPDGIAEFGDEETLYI